MTIHVQQHIHIGSLRIEAISNSSMLQIGTSGGVNATSYSNEIPPMMGAMQDSTSSGEFFFPSLVPLPNPT